MDYSCNEKGSILPEVRAHVSSSRVCFHSPLRPQHLMRHFQFIDKLREAKGQPDLWVISVLDGVQIHVTEAMLTFFHCKKMYLALRPPWTSHALQNEVCTGSNLARRTL